MKALAERPRKRLRVTLACRMDACELCETTPPPSDQTGEEPPPPCACRCHRPEHG
ncbi:hypothetical protein [Streptomyces clavuligerus]|uniref:Uncharacterized protein n=1 Tax=Streptomyces clavuligerus TaxID=1901 RepID=B5GXF9_STRCL|nr:hypothetical protein [Streptomyces clavuligerus]EDY51005.1 hypothetical protein SSCG_04130 [Streptomyces clavuligerus]EFG06542.1 Hypothetical protein SCLAV_1465 [Streptomyces clavuligerus]MBY6305170.1 hypothetical protein [Streptomyces clavuligerus]QPL65109.1 hypothetical protein I3J04_21120 [Streptomyces clavuligerus]QPL71140.1 hypothetical protein I3J05_21130 [Streptomyces clavuligerus]